MQSSPLTLRRVFVPLVTPFTEDGQIDVPALEKLTHRVVEANASPFILGTTGEYASLSRKKRTQVVKTVCEVSRGKQPVFAGISGTCMEESLETAEEYTQLGVHAVVAHPPGYYPIGGTEMQMYFTLLADRLPVPLLLYNIPVTTHHSIPLSVVEALSHHPNIIGIKDSERDETRLREAVALFRERPDFAHLTGWGARIGNALRWGSRGMVPGTGNVIPGLYHQMLIAADREDWEVVEHLQKISDRVSALYQSQRRLSQALAALKVILHQMGLCAPHVLPPLIPCSEEEARSIGQQFREIKQEWPEFFSS